MPEQLEQAYFLRSPEAEVAVLGAALQDAEAARFGISAKTLLREGL